MVNQFLSFYFHRKRAHTAPDAVGRDSRRRRAEFPEFRAGAGRAGRKPPTARRFSGRPTDGRRSRRRRAEKREVSPAFREHVFGRPCAAPVHRTRRSLRKKNKDK